MVCMWPGFLKGEMIMSAYECHMGAIRMTKHDLIPSNISTCEGFRHFVGYVFRSNWLLRLAKPLETGKLKLKS